MGLKQSTKEAIKEFMRGQDQVLVLPFEGLRRDVSKHWHRFLETSLWRLVWKAFILGITRSMHWGR